MTLLSQERGLSQRGVPGSAWERGCSPLTPWSSPWGRWADARKHYRAGGQRSEHLGSRLSWWRLVGVGSHVSLAALCTSLEMLQPAVRMPFSGQNCLPGTSKQRKGAPSWRGSVSGISESPSLGWSPHLLSGSDHFCLVCGNPAELGKEQPAWEASELKAQTR